MMRAFPRLVLLLAIVGGLAPLPACKNNGQPTQTTAPSLSRATVAIDTGERKVSFRVELALTPAEQERGLMFRESLAADEGMLFVFDRQSVHTFWMRNTLIPLSVAFIGADGTIVNIADMKPKDETTHCAQRAVPFALEMERGWFASRGIKAGQKIGGLEKAPPPR